MGRFLKVSLIGVLLFYVFSWAVGLLLNNHYLKFNIYKPTVAYNFEQEPTHIILGSSRGLTSLNTKKIQEERGETGEIWYNMSMDDSSPEIHLLMIKLMLERGIQPQKIYLQYDRTRSKNIDQEWQDNDYRMIPLVHSSEAVDQYFRVKPNYFYVKYLPLSVYAYYNTELIYPAAYLWIKPEYRHRFDAYGDVTYPNEKPLRWTGKQKEITLALQDPTLLAIEKLCKESNIELVLFTSPFIDRKVVNTPPDFLNYSQAIEKAAYFYDAQHINGKGKQLLTEKFLHELKD